MARETIAPDYCGQQQPHAAHIWHTPPTYGTTTLIQEHQCAGLTPFAALVAPDPGSDQ
jgi:hypothetical protein